jgi:hypothetical protein
VGARPGAHLDTIRRVDLPSERCSAATINRRRMDEHHIQPESGADYRPRHDVPQ